MGVINLTPNSFSDGGKAFEQKWWEQDFDIYDIGAESTAPFNQAITQETELKRLKEYLYPHLNKLKGKTLSLDSYKIKTMESFLKTFKDFNLIINDVSGQIEPEYLELLKRHPKVHFVLGHNLVPKREQTSLHMNYAQKRLSDIKGYFQERLGILQDHHLENRVIFDPCFGFAKTREQNIELLKDLPELIQSFDKKIPWLIGISRKSFLRNPVDMDPKLKINQEKLDAIGSTYLTKLMHELPQFSLIMRVHTPENFDRAMLALNFL